MTDRQLKRLCFGFRKGLIQSRKGDMMCGIVSYALHGYLGFMGISAEVEEVDLKYSNHVFLRMSDGRVLDATADQFGGPKVYMGEPLWYHQNQNQETA